MKWLEINADVEICDPCRFNFQLSNFSLTNLSTNMRWVCALYTHSFPKVQLCALRTLRIQVSLLFISVSPLVKATLTEIITSLSLCQKATNFNHFVLPESHLRPLPTLFPVIYPTCCSSIILLNLCCSTVHFLVPIFLNLGFWKGTRRNRKLGSSWSFIFACKFVFVVYAVRCSCLDDRLRSICRRCCCNRRGFIS